MEDPAIQVLLFFLSFFSLSRVHMWTFNPEMCSPEDTFAYEPFSPLLINDVNYVHSLSCVG